jgi:hypothetical protein
MGQMWIFRECTCKCANEQRIELSVVFFFFFFFLRIYVMHTRAFNVIYRYIYLNINLCRVK